MFEAATKAYHDAGINPRRDVDFFVTCAEDYLEGYSIFDEFVPDQLGAVLKPLHTVSGDGLYGLACAYMQILTGAADIVAVEAHSKASNLLTHSGVVAFALDPVLNRPLGGHPYYIAGLEMKRYMHETGTTKEQCARVVQKNRGNALDNPDAAYGAEITVEDVLDSEPMFGPINRLDMSSLADGCVVIVLASGEIARDLCDTPIWIKGIGWGSDTPRLESRDWGKAIYAELAARMAYKMAGITNPRKEIDFAEIDDKFSYKELQHLEDLKLCGRGEAGKLAEEGAFERGGDLPVNPSGGCLGVGNLLEACGLQKVLEIVLQLRQEAGKRQLKGVKTGLAQSWRGVPTASGAVVVLGI